jgi:hypothetical protein
MSAATQVRTCALEGCDASLEGMRSDARHCSDSHRGMAFRGERLQAPGVCAYCGGPLRSVRQRYCSDTHRWQAWKLRQRGGFKQVLTATAGVQADRVPQCACGGRVSYRDEIDGDVRCVTCARTLVSGHTADLGWDDLIDVMGAAA